MNVISIAKRTKKMIDFHKSFCEHGPENATAAHFSFVVDTDGYQVTIRNEMKVNFVYLLL